MGPRMRVANWHVHLSALFNERRHTPFAWGGNDCCLFAADCAWAITGTDPAATLRGYSSELEAARVLRDNGGLAGIMDARYPRLASPRLAQRGDVVIATGDDGREVLAVVAGEFAWCPGPHGLTKLHQPRWLSAWRVT